MELKNQGIFSVIYRKEIDRYVIVYNERGILTALNEHNFKLYDEAVDYIDSNKEKLDNIITDIKEVERKAKEEEEKIRLAAEVAERKKREEAERKKQEKANAKQKKKAEKEKNKQKKKEQQEKKKKKRKAKITKVWKEWKRFVAGFVAAIIMLTGGHFAGVGISSAIKNQKNKTSDKESSSVTSEQEIQSTTAPTEQETIDPTIGIIDSLEDEEVLTYEEYEKLVTNFTKQYVDNQVNVTTEDLVKFVSIANIDELVEDNYELASELFSQQSKEEYLNDAAKVIGMTYTYNRNVFEKEQSTAKFIKISDAIFGSQKEVVKVIENYVDQIAMARNDAEEANRLISELLQKLGDPTSELSYLDDGVGFAIQSNIELIRSYLAKDVISKENLDMLTILTSSEEYVSNIFVVYDKCVNSGKVLTRG